MHHSSRHLQSLLHLIRNPLTLILHNIFLFSLSGITRTKISGIENYDLLHPLHPRDLCKCSRSRRASRIIVTTGKQNTRFERRSNGCSSFHGHHGPSSRYIQPGKLYKTDSQHDKCTKRQGSEMRQGELHNESRAARKEGSSEDRYR